MAYGKKTGGRNFEKNHPSYNTGLSKEVKELRSIARDNHIKIVVDSLNKSKDQLRAILESRKSTAEESLIASLILHAIKKGDAYIYEKIMDRAIGKVPLPVSNESGAVIVANFDNQDKRL